MQIEFLRRINFQELEKKLRQVPLMQKNEQDPPILVYKDANITLKQLYYHEVNPPTFYLLKTTPSSTRIKRTAHGKRI